MMFGILLFLRMNLLKLDRMYFIDTSNFVQKKYKLLILDFRKYFQLLHLMNIMSSLKVLGIITCFLMHGNVNIVKKEMKVRLV